MSPIYVDTSFYQALLNPRDQWHQSALELSNMVRGPTVTSEYVLCELGALMSPPDLRAIFVKFVRSLESNGFVEIIQGSREQFQAGFSLFSTRPDKAWSLTDCVSFALMERRGIENALAFDHHFEQAGFQLLSTQ